ncbi:hypothetical protein L249_6077 [Ophiocordyceps polyrhachis-furcata BCC 54312]|uniref:Uncharacterized protein n=1 Tax=Ophiocordyceps polyrhachis-furcata BCC 54312 TaxID=1330021 RepID=A0A367LIE9_9HYPO|nr:hypothetical protein L249_6077 [Ophiocordyceps polyrhachis-furcata BCC 54312]
MQEVSQGGRSGGEREASATPAYDQYLVLRFSTIPTNLGCPDDNTWYVSHLAKIAHLLQQPGRRPGRGEWTRLAAAWPKGPGDQGTLPYGLRNSVVIEETVKDFCRNRKVTWNEKDFSEENKMAGFCQERLFGGWRGSEICCGALRPCASLPPPSGSQSTQSRVETWICPFNGRLNDFPLPVVVVFSSSFLLDSVAGSNSSLVLEINHTRPTLRCIDEAHQNDIDSFRAHLPVSSLVTTGAADSPPADTALEPAQIMRVPPLLALLMAPPTADATMLELPIQLIKGEMMSGTRRIGSAAYAPLLASPSSLSLRPVASPARDGTLRHSKPQPHVLSEPLAGAATGKRTVSAGPSVVLVNRCRGGCGRLQPTGSIPAQHWGLFVGERLMEAVWALKEMIRDTNQVESRRLWSRGWASPPRSSLRLARG